MTLKVCQYMEGCKTAVISGEYVYCSQELHDRYEAGERLEVNAIRLPTYDEILQEPFPITPINYKTDPMDAIRYMRYST